MTSHDCVMYPRIDCRPSSQFLWALHLVPLSTIKTEMGITGLLGHVFSRFGTVMISRVIDRQFRNKFPGSHALG